MFLHALYGQYLILGAFVSYVYLLDLVGEWSILLILNPFLSILALIKVFHAPKDHKERIKFE